MKNLKTFVESHRKLLASAWSDETANPRSRPLPKNRLPSFGQCEVASAVLFNRLKPNYADANWRLVYGRVLSITTRLGHTTMAPIIDEHFWIDFSPEKSKIIDATVVDVTCDQASHPSIGAFIVETYDDLSRRGIVYQPRQFYPDTGHFADSMAQYNSNFYDRFKLLQSRVELFAGP